MVARAGGTQRVGPPVQGLRGPSQAPRVQLHGLGCLCRCKASAPMHTPVYACRCCGQPLSSPVLVLARRPYWQKAGLVSTSNSTGKYTGIMACNAELTHNAAFHSPASGVVVTAQGQLHRRLRGKAPHGHQHDRRGRGCTVTRETGDGTEQAVGKEGP